LKSLKGLTPYEFIHKQWTIEPQRFNINPIQKLAGLNIQDMDGMDIALERLSSKWEPVFGQKTQVENKDLEPFVEACAKQKRL